MLEVNKPTPSYEVATIQIGTTYARGEVIERCGAMATVRVNEQLLSGAEVRLLASKLTVVHE